MTRPLRGLLIGSLILLAGGALVAHAAPARHDATPPAATPAACGTPVDAWGAAVADDVRIELLGRAVAATPEAGTPVIGVTAEFDLTISNSGSATIGIDAERITLTTCFDAALHPHGSSTLLGDYAPGEARQGSLRFRLAPADKPTELTIEIREPDRTGARVTCPLIVPYTDPTPRAEIAVGCSAVGGQGAAGDDVGG